MSLAARKHQDLEPPNADESGSKRRPSPAFAINVVVLLLGFSASLAWIGLLIWGARTLLISGAGTG
jgi:hypothetical protein